MSPPEVSSALEPKQLHWRSSTTEFETASLDSLTRYLRNYPTGLGAQRVAQDVWMKRRMDVNESEFLNQNLVWKLCDPNILCVPKPLRYFPSQDEHGIQQGNLLMEFVHGRTVENLLMTAEASNLELVCEKVFAAVQHLQQVSRGKLSQIGSLHSEEITVGANARL